MGIDLDTLKAIQASIRPLANRIINSFARGVVRLTNDAKGMQRLQVDGFPGGPSDRIEHFQSYGFSSVPLAGAKAALAFLNGGDRSHPIAVAVADPRYRPKGGDPGEVTLYHYQGAKVTFLTGGNVEIQPGPGGQVFVRDEAGVADALVKKSEFNTHLHTAPTGGGPTTVPTVLATGTTKLKAE